jgi:hypothetical protein
VSVADTFDAMTTNRPYQKAMEITYVFTRMRSFIGKKFEKHFVEALITAYEEGLIRPNMKVDSVLKTAPAAAPAASPAPETRELPAPRMEMEPLRTASPAFQTPPVAPPPIPPAPVAAPAPRAASSAPAPLRVEESHGMGPPPALMDRIR